MERDRNFVYLDKFLWDTWKNEKNQHDHKISFEVAARIFDDPLLYTEYDKENSEAHGEYRERCIGSVNGILILLVAKTDVGDKIRMYSARKALPKEVKIYERNAKTLLEN